MSVSVDNDVSVLAVEHVLKLFEDGLALLISFGQFAKGVIVVGAPEEATLGETSMAVTVGTDSDVVIGFETCNRLEFWLFKLTVDFAPKLDVFEADGRW